MSEKDEKKVAAGQARAQSLTPARRSEIAKAAATRRWSGNLQTADYEGKFRLGDAEIACAVLPDGTRIITQATFLRALGRSRSPKAGTGVMSTVDELPFFLQADALKPFISNELIESTKAVFYYGKSGSKGVGYDAKLLPQVAEVYLKLRDDSMRVSGKVPTRYEKMIISADILMRALANVGIVALVDEATGYQRDRASDALAKILEAFIAKELQPYVPTFPQDFYKEMFRLRDLDFPQDSVKRPQYFGLLTNDIIYKRLAPGVLDELKRATPKLESGRYKDKLFQRLSTNKGYLKLREHLGSVVTAMKLSDNWDDFIRKLDRLHPRFGDTIPLDFDSAPDNGKGL
jgi:hypothetical protein